MNIAELGDQDLVRYGDYEALVVGEQTWTNRTLHDEAARLASAFIALGITPGERIIVAVPSGRAALIASTAAWRCGAVVVYVSASAPASELDPILEHCAASAIVGTAAALSAKRPRIAISIDRELDELVARHPPLDRAVERGATDPAQLCYTSGTTGRLKGVIYSHGGIGAMLSRYRAIETQKAAEPIVSLVALPPTSFAGLVLANRWASLTKLVVLEQFDPRACLDVIVRDKITRLSIVPSMGEALVAVAAGRVQSSLKEVIASGAHMSIALADALERTFGVRPAITYGMTEVGGAISWTTRDAKAGSVGKIVEGVEVSISSTGEVCVKSPWMALGYWRDPEQTAAVFRDGWIHTGDLGRLDADGELYLVGRSKEIIIQAGFNVAPHEVADVIRASPGVAQCAVVGIPHGMLGEEVVACVVRAPGSAITAHEIVAHCRAKLDARKLPGRVLFFDALPMTDGGKVKTAELHDWVVRSTSDAENTALVRRLRGAASHERLAIVRAELVRLVHACRAPALTTAVDPSATFAENGLTSMDKVLLTHELTSALGRAVAVTMVYRYPTIDLLSDELLWQLDLHDAARPAPATRPHTRTDREPIAIVGVACRLPGDVHEPEQFWDLLRRGADTVRDPPPDRLKDLDAVYDPGRPAPGKTYVRQASFLADADAFDAGFFGMTAEAIDIDPQHRLVLEVSWEALESAGYDPRAHPGRVGMMLGISGSSHYQTHDALGIAPSMAVGRLCHFLNLRGPAFAIDTSCSSSLVALHEAVGALRIGECDAAIVAGVNVMSSAEPLIELSQMELLARDGRCKAFDANGDGFAPGEGCIAIVVKRLSDAIAHGDRIHALIRGTAINHDGRSSSLAAPNPRAQEEVIRAALASADARPDDVQYVETHGTGTIVGDPIEVDGLTSVFGQRATPLAIGSVKSNVGHLVAGAGLAGVLKTVLAMQHRELPASLHVKALNPHIAWNEIPIRVQRELGPWPDAAAPLIAGVSSFGLSGTNAHVVLAEAPAVSSTDPDPAVRVLPISARTSAALKDVARRFADMLDSPTASARDIAYTASCRRAHLPHRLAVIGADTDEWKQRLRSFAAGQGASRLVSGHAQGAPRLVFVFSGQGSQWLGMGRDLFANEPVFRATIEQCDAAMKPYTDWSLLDQLLHATTATTRMGDTGALVPMLCAMQLGIAAVLESWGVVPSAVLGHSMGELAAARVSGALTLDEVARIACIRSGLMRRVDGRGLTALVELSAEQAEIAIAKYGGGVSIAAINGARTTVVSGDTAMINELVAELGTRDVFCRVVRVACATHSSQMDVLQHDLIAQLGAIVPRPTEIRFVSTAVPGDTQPVLDASYWWLNMRNPVRMFPRIQQLHAETHTLFVEIGAHSVLAGSIAETGRVVATLRRNEPEREVLLETLGALHCAGSPVDWTRHFAGPGRVVTLPGYAWQHQRFWAEPAKPRHTERLAPLLHRHVELLDDPGKDVFELELDLEDPELAYLRDHSVQGQIWLPNAVLLELAWEGASHVYGSRLTGLRDIRFERTLVVSEPRKIQLVLRESSFQIFSRAPGASPTLHAHGVVRLGECAPEPAADIAALKRACPTEISIDAFYGELSTRGFELGPAFRRLGALWRGTNEVLAYIPPSDRHDVHPAVLDACFQCVTDDGEEGRVATALAELVIHAGTTQAAWVHASPNSFALLDDAGRVLVEAKGIRTESIALAEDRSLYAVAWREATRAAAANASGVWLVFADRSGVAGGLAEQLALAGVRVVTVYAGDDADDPAHVDRLFDDQFAGGPPQRIVHLWSLDAGESLERSRLLSVMHLVQALARRGWDAATRLFLVTRGAQSAGSDSSGVAQSPLWGFGGSLVHEFPRLAATLVDLDDRGAEGLYDELVHADGELRVALRGGKRLVARLEPHRGAPATEDRVQLHDDRTYLVTGGSGGLGGVVARRLVELGARHIALMSRSEPGAEARALIQELEAAGARVVVARADVANARELDAALADLAVRMPRLGGIVHAAGVVDDGVVVNLDVGRVHKVLAPKLSGAWNLHQRTKDQELDFFVLFSSIAGVSGSPGQAHYAAANAFLDELAQFRRRRGLPAQSIAWGGWREVGMAARSKLASQRGGSITNADGAAIFERLLRDPAPHVIVMHGDRPWRNASFDATTHPLFAELVAARGAEPAPKERSLVERLQLASDPDRLRVLEDYLRTTIGQHLATPPEELSLSTPLTQLGVDSLATQRIRNLVRAATGLDVVLADMFGVTISELAARLGTLFNAPRTPSPSAAVSSLELRQTGASSARATTHQEMFWYTERDDPAANIWVTVAFVVAGPLDRAALDRSMTALVDAHSIFRTAYREVEREVHQVILRAAEAPKFELEYADHSPVSESDWAAELERTMHELVARGFDVARGLVIRARLTRLAPDRHALVFVVHHIACDAGSLGAFTRRLFALYKDECDGKTARERPPLQFIDLADAIVRWNATPSGRASSAYWRDRLRGVSPVEVPGDLPRAPVDSHRDAVPYGITASPMHPAERAEVQTELRARVSTLARQEHATPPIVYLSALIWLLHRETGQTDICVEAVTNVRTAQPGLQDLQGMLTTWLLYRVNVAGCATLREVVARTKDVVAAAQEHLIIGDYYDLVPHTVRRVVFNYVAGAPPEAPLAGGLQIVQRLSQVAGGRGTDVAARGNLAPVPSAHEQHRWKRPWDLHVNVVETPGPALVIWTGSESIFGRAKLTALLQRYLDILIAAMPELT